MADNADFYFKSYTEWRDALTVRERIASLENADDPHTQEFAQKYGQAYLQQVIAWFKQAAG